MIPSHLANLFVKKFSNEDNLILFSLRLLNFIVVTLWGALLFIEAVPEAVGFAPVIELILNVETNESPATASCNKGIPVAATVPNAN